MLTPSEISGKISDLSDARLSLYEFEKWFRVSSRNFHTWADDRAKDMVYEIEHVLSDYHFDGLKEAQIPKELAAAILPFESKARSYRATVAAVQVYSPVRGTTANSGKPPRKLMTRAASFSPYRVGIIRAATQ